MFLLIAITIFFLFGISFKIYKDIWCPNCLITIVWGSIFLLYYLLSPDLYTLGDRFYICILEWLLSFYIFCNVAYAITPIHSMYREPNLVIIKIYTILVPLFLIISSYLILKIALNSNFIFVYLRSMNTGLDDSIETVDLGVFAYLNSLILISLLLEVAIFGFRRRVIIALLILANIIFAVLTMAKLSLFTVFICSLVVASQKQLINKKKVLISIGVLFCLMILFQYLRTHDNEGFNISFINNYLFNGIVAFDRVDIPNHQPTGGLTFRFFYAIGESLGLTENLNKSTILEYISVGNNSTTNVYTCLYPFYHDFGYFGVFVFGGFYGILSGIFYKLSKKSIPALILYSIIAATIIFQFFADLISVNTSTMIQYAIYAYLPFILKKRNDRYFISNLQRGKIY